MITFEQHHGDNVTVIFKKDGITFVANGCQTFTYHKFNVIARKFGVALEHQRDVYNSAGVREINQSEWIELLSSVEIGMTISADLVTKVSYAAQLEIINHSINGHDAIRWIVEPTAEQLEAHNLAVTRYQQKMDLK